ncbi:MAG: Fur family transcriptional regulator [Gammaproteobacteria bacterium]
MLKRAPRQPLSQQQVIDLLASRDIQPTLQRLEIAQVLFARDQHLSADEVLKLVNQDTARVSKATVYNTLGLFAAKGLIREVIVDPSRVFYDPNTDEHHHFYNVDTGELLDIDAEQLSVVDLPPLPKDTVAEGVDIIIRIRNQTPA